MPLDKKKQRPLIEAFITRPLVLLAAFTLIIRTPLLEVDSESVIYILLVFEVLGVFIWHKFKPIPQAYLSVRKFRISKKTAAIMLVPIASIILFTTVNNVIRNHYKESQVFLIGSFDTSTNRIGYVTVKSYGFLENDTVILQYHDSRSGGSERTEVAEYSARKGIHLLGNYWLYEHLYNGIKLGKSPSSTVPITVHLKWELIGADPSFGDPKYIYELHLLHPKVEDVSRRGDYLDINVDKVESYSRRERVSKSRIGR